MTSASVTRTAAPTARMTAQGICFLLTSESSPPGNGLVVMNGLRRGPAGAGSLAGGAASRTACGDAGSADLRAPGIGLSAPELPQGEPFEGPNGAGDAMIGLDSVSTAVAEA
jgi:hypothetical protein